MTSIRWFGGTSPRSARRNLAAALAAILAIAWAAPALADPPPWAPARGYRAQQAAPRVHQPDIVVAPVIDFGTCYRERLGQLLGGAAGAAVGSQFGSGDGQVAATIGGAIIGLLVGGSVGRSMDELDQHCVGQVLEYAEDGQAVDWYNPDSGVPYQVTPTHTYQGAQGQYCRDYTTMVTIDGLNQQRVGTACRRSDGLWELIS